jgi:integrase
LERLTDKELLNFALENGIIDILAIQEQIEMNERKKYLEMHRYKIFLGSDGYYHTHVLDDTKKNKRRGIKKKLKQSLEDAIIEHYKNSENEPYLCNVFEKWIESKLNYGEIEKQTADRYRNDFKRFFANHKLYDRKMRYITEEDLEDFIKSTIHNMELTAKAWANLRTIINGTFKFAKKKGYTQISITHFMGDLDLSRKAFKKVRKSDEESVFTDREINTIMSHIDNAEPSLINLGIVLAFQAGLRAGEIAALKYSDLNGNVLSVNKTEIRYKDENGHYVFEVRDFTKGEIGRRKVILTEMGVAAIKRARMLNPWGEYLFTENGKRIRGKDFTVRIKKICEYVGILPRSLHKARKTYGTKLLNAGLSEKLIESQMGHTDIATTKGYYWFNNIEEEEIKTLVANALR